jgi:polysaccharide biosynthesis/export protein
MRRSGVICAGLALSAMAVLPRCVHRPVAALGDEGQGEYRIGREDLLDISVWRDADLTRTVPVRPDGRISLPLVGELDVAGQTPAVVAKEITSRLAPYIEDPRVVVIVREINAPRFFVIGEVARPGAFPLRGRITVLQALSLAGGPNEFADRSGIVVLRSMQSARIELDYSELVSEGGARDIALQPGDTIYVP